MTYKVNIDAGHGSNTAGKRTCPFTKNIDINGDGKVDIKKGESYREHYANVAVAVELEKELKRCGISVNKTAWNDANGKDDEDVSLTTRQAKIKAAKCDISVSIHFNAAGSADKFSSAEGISTHIHNNSARVGNSAALAKAVHSQLIKGTAQKDRGVVKQELAMCNCPMMGTKAAILVELGFMTNEKEAQTMMANAKFHKECAQEIAKGICSYAGIKYVEEPKKVTASTTTTSYIVKVTETNLPILKGAGKTFGTNGSVKKNEKYTIVQTKSGYGKLKSGAGWLELSGTAKC